MGTVSFSLSCCQLHKAPRERASCRLISIAQCRQPITQVGLQRGKKGEYVHGVGGAGGSRYVCTPKPAKLPGEIKKAEQGLPKLSENPATEPQL